MLPVVCELAEVGASVVRREDGACAGNPMKKIAFDFFVQTGLLI